jgi:hypothetical protein
MKEAQLGLPSDQITFNCVERLPHLLDDSIGVFACFTGQGPPRSVGLTSRIPPGSDGLTDCRMAAGVLFGRWLAGSGGEMFDVSRHGIGGEPVPSHRI